MRASPTALQLRRFTAITRYGMLLWLLPMACGGSDPVWPGDGAVRVLFIGNSLTFYNDLPDMLHELAQADGGRVLETRDLSQAAYALEDHWNDGWPREVLAEGGWDVVILQQGPSSLPENRENLVTWSMRWANAIRAQGGVPALYMVWPERARMSYFDDVSLSYRIAAEAADGVLFPAGDAWIAAWDEDPTLPLYGPDDFHPSEMGTYLAALTIYRGLTGREPPSLAIAGVSDVADDILHGAARRAVEAVTLETVGR